MPMYDYKCEQHGYFEQRKRIADREWDVCPQCALPAKQVLISPPGLDIEGMADLGMPGAFELSGDRMEKRHRTADQAGDWASRDSLEFGDSAGVNRKDEFIKAARERALKVREGIKAGATHRSSG